MSSNVLKVQHTSLQFSDTYSQQTADVERLFKRGAPFPIKTGTEAGPGTHLLAELKEAAKDYNHEFRTSRANWVAVDRAIIKRGTVEHGEVFVIDNSFLVGQMHDRVMPFIGFTHINPEIGRVYQAAAHYAIKGRRPGDPNYKANQRYAMRIAEWMHQHGKGSNLVFVNGDFNMLDNQTSQDWAFGREFLSMADELKAWKNTGHGPIDGFCSFNHDRRVSAQRFKVLDDKKMFLNTDHFACQGWWKIQAK